MADAEKVQDGFEGTAKQANKDAESMGKFSKKFAGVMAIVAASMGAAVSVLLLKIPVLQEIFSGVGFIIESLAFLMDDVLRPALEPLADALFNLGEKFETLPGPLKEVLAWTALVLGVTILLAAAIIPLVVAIVLAGEVILVVIAVIIGLGVWIAVIIAAIILLRYIWESDFLKIKTIVTTTIGVIQSVIGAFVDWFMENFGEEIQETVDAVSKVFEVWGGVVTGVLDEVMKIFKVALGVIVKLWEEDFGGMRTYFETVFEAIKVVATTVWEIITTIIETAINAVLNVIQVALALLVGDWASAWTNMKEFVTGIVDGISSIVATIGDGVVGLLNIVIGAMNTVINGLNSISISIPDWVPGVGGESFGFDIANIPTLDLGGVVTAPTLAALSVNKRPEAVLPLDRLEDMFRRFDTARDDTFNLSMDGRKVGGGVQRRNQRFFGAQGVF